LVKSCNEVIAMTEDRVKAQPADEAVGESAEVAPTEADADDVDAGPVSGDVRALLKRALPPAPPGTDDEILRGVQEKIRKRSGGKFYGDGWSRMHGKQSYLLLALVMLVVLAVGYLLVSPLAVGR
jgi:hypothetical protein